MLIPARIESPPIVTLDLRYCQWCGSHEACIHDLDGAWCCELHRDADRAGQKPPAPYTAGSGGDGCVHCGQMPNDCTGGCVEAARAFAHLDSPRIARAIVFGGVTR